MCTVRVVLPNLRTQFRPTKTKNTGFLPLPASIADYTRAHDSEQISKVMIAHHTVNGKARNLQRSSCLYGEHISTWRVRHLVSRGQTYFCAIAVKGHFALDNISANGPNGAISLTQTFNRILFYVRNRRYFGVQKSRIGKKSGILQPQTNIRQKEKRKKP